MPPAVNKAAKNDAEPPPPPPPADVFEKSIGSFGRWQLYMSILISFSKFPIAWHIMNIIIIAPPQPFTCANNEDQCAPDCSEHIYNRSVFTNTIQSQWDLVCDRAHLANLPQTVTMLGVLVGCFAVGFWADRFGRRMPIVVSVMVQAVTGISAAFIPWYWAFVVLRFVNALATGALMVVTFVLVMELVGTKWRCVITAMYYIPGAIGHLTLSPLAYLIRDWRYSQLAMSAASFVYVLYYWLIPESPRWLVAVGKVDKAVVILEKAAKYNRRPTESIAADVQAFVQQKQTETRAKGRCIDLFNNWPMFFRTLAISINWTVVGLCYYGIAQFMAHLGGNIFVNIAISASIQIPAALLSILFLMKLGRKPTIIIAYIVSSSAIFALCFMEAESAWEALPTAISMAGYAIAFPAVYIFSGELFPTIIRNFGVGITSMMARVGSLVAPFVATLRTLGYYPWLAPAIFAAAPAIGFIFVLFLPETKNAVLPDTIEEAKLLGKKEPKDKKPDAGTSKGGDQAV